jgi:hypothetical protein
VADIKIRDEKDEDGNIHVRISGVLEIKVRARRC